MSIIFILLAALTAAAPAIPVGVAATALKFGTQAVKGDWHQILERGTIRIVVPYSRTLFFNDRGNQMGLAAEIIREFDQYYGAARGRMYQRLRALDESVRDRP